MTTTPENADATLAAFPLAATLDGSETIYAIQNGSEVGLTTEQIAALAGGSSGSGKSAYQIAVDGGYVGTQAQWISSLQGAAGANAYQLAVAGGYTGTQAQWIASLQGAAGASAYQLAVAGGYTGTQAQWLASLQGAVGESAYQLAVDGGYSGTQAAWIASLKGATGATGPQGPQGPTGATGATGPAGSSSGTTDPAAQPAGTTPSGTEKVLVNQSGTVSNLTTAQILGYNTSTLNLWQTFDTVALMKAGVTGTYPRVKWRGYNYVGDGGGGEGIYVVPASGQTYTADEGTIFATTAGGYVLRDIPHGDVKTPWFGMTAPSGPIGTSLDTTSTAGTYNPSTDFAPALQAAANFAALAGRALHIVGRYGSYRLMSTVKFPGVRKIYGDGPTVDSNFGTTLQWYPSTITDQAVGIVLTDVGQLFENIAIVTQDTGYLNVTSQTLISGGWLTLPSGFSNVTSTLPYSAFKAGLFGMRIDNKAIVRNVTTSGGKGGILVNCATGHVVFENVSAMGNLIGRYWIANGEDHFIIGGGADGQFCCEMVTELAVAVTAIRYHQYHNPYGWYQVSTGSSASPSGFNLYAIQNSVEGIGEAWIWLADNAGNTNVSYSGGGIPYATSFASATTASESLPDAFFSNGVRRTACSGRFGYVNSLNYTGDRITAQGGTGTYAARIMGFPPNPKSSDLTIFTSIDTSSLDAGYSPWLSSNVTSRNTFVMADRSDVAVKTRNPPVGNLVLRTNAYSSSMGLGAAGNNLASNGGAWTQYNGNSSYPGSLTLNTYANLVASGVALVIPESIARQVGPNPLVFALTNTAPTGTTAQATAYQVISANNIADGLQGLYFSLYVAGSYNVAYQLNGTGTFATTGNVATTNPLTFQAITQGGRILPAGTTLTQYSLSNNVSATTTYFIAPMVSFGAWFEYNPHAHPASLDPMYLASGLRQAGRTFVTTTASGGATTAVTIADFLVSVDTTAAAGTVTLPSTPFDGEVHVIKKSDTSANTLTINGNGNTIDGSSTLVLAASVRSSARVQYIGTAATPYWCVT